MMHTYLLTDTRLKNWFKVRKKKSKVDKQKKRS